MVMEKPKVGGDGLTAVSLPIAWIALSTVPYKPLTRELAASSFLLSDKLTPLVIECHEMRTVRIRTSLSYLPRIRLPNQFF